MNDEDGRVPCKSPFLIHVIKAKKGESDVEVRSSSDVFFLLRLLPSNRLSWRLIPGENFVSGKKKRVREVEGFPRV